MDKEPHKEPTLKERLDAQAAAKRRLLERFKPRPMVAAPPEAFVVDDAALEQVRRQRRAERQAEKQRRWAAQACTPRQPDPAVVVTAAREAQQAAQERPPRQGAPTIYFQPNDGGRGKTTPQAKQVIADLQGNLCYLCGCDFDDHVRPTTEHVRPRARRGANRANRLMACLPCNQAKGDREPHPCELLYLEAVNLALDRRGDAEQLEWVDEHPSTA